ncbi:MAG: hypothetical protein MJ180_01010 [Candidatus Gastranaerophilales bacterium]|nr:hypothetical protein [Candidatus Gastranaerophilales bacterium]
MADITIGTVTNGIQARQNDAFGVSRTLADTQFFKTAVSNPQQRDEFVNAIKLRQEMALAGGNKQMYDLLGNLLTAAKSAPKLTPKEEKTTGNKFDTNNLFAV